MKKTSIHRPYFNDSKGQTHTFFSDRKKAGVYLVYDGKKVIYVGYSGADVYKTMYRHFQSWEDRRQYRATFNRQRHKVRVVYCTEPQAWKLEKALILKYKPEYNENTFDMFDLISQK